MVFKFQRPGSIDPSHSAPCCFLLPLMSWWKSIFYFFYFVFFFILRWELKTAKKLKEKQANESMWAINYGKQRKNDFRRMMIWWHLLYQHSELFHMRDVSVRFITRVFIRFRQNFDTSIFCGMYFWSIYIIVLPFKTPFPQSP